MSNWTVSEWLTYVPFILGALLLAVIQGAKDMTNPPFWLPRLFFSTKWNYVPLVLMLVGGAFFGLRQAGVIGNQVSVPRDKDIDDLKAENSQPKGSLSAAQSQLQLALNDARKWRFSYKLRNTPKAENGERIPCQYAVGVSHTNAAFHSWAGLQQMLDLAWWRDAPTGGPTNNEFPYPPGITIRAGPQPTNSFKCASALQTALADIFSLNAALHVDQVTPSLSACKNECVEIDVGN